MEYILRHISLFSDLCLFTAVIEEVGYVNFLEIAGPQNLMGGWPMVQSNWDESKFSAFKVRISIK